MYSILMTALIVRCVGGAMGMALPAVGLSLRRDNLWRYKKWTLVYRGKPTDMFQGVPWCATWKEMRLFHNKSNSKPGRLSKTLASPYDYCWLVVILQQRSIFPPQVILWRFFFIPSLFLIATLNSDPSISLKFAKYNKINNKQTYDTMCMSF